MFGGGMMSGVGGGFVPGSFGVGVGFGVGGGGYFGGPIPIKSKMPPIKYAPVSFPYSKSDK